MLLSRQWGGSCTLYFPLDALYAQARRFCIIWYYYTHYAHPLQSRHRPGRHKEAEHLSQGTAADSLIMAPHLHKSFILLLTPQPSVNVSLASHLLAFWRRSYTSSTNVPKALLKMLAPPKCLTCICFPFLPSVHIHHYSIPEAVIRCHLCPAPITHPSTHILDPPPSHDAPVLHRRIPQVVLRPQPGVHVLLRVIVGRLFNARLPRGTHFWAAAHSVGCGRPGPHGGSHLSSRYKHRWRVVCGLVVKLRCM